MARLPAALSFTAKGKNQFRNAHSASTKMRAARNAAEQRALLNRSAAESNKVVAEQLRLPEPDDARAVIREGRRLLKRNQQT
jgi:hypothetical protein